MKERPIAWLVVSPLEWHGEALSFGCDPQVAQTVADLAWEDVVARHEKSPMRAVLFYGWDGEPPPGFRFEGASQHADFDEASVLGGTDPGMVDRTRFGVVERDRKVKLLREHADRIDFEKGRRILEYRAEQLERRVRATAKDLGLGAP